MIERIRPTLVTIIPASPQAGILYVSVEYATTLHLCACGCGHAVVLGISPRDWTVLWDGETVTIDPSVGNWSFPCQSHYLIRRNQIVRVSRWSDQQIAGGRARDAARHARPQAFPVAVAAADELVDARAQRVFKRLFGRIVRRWTERRSIRH